MSPLASLEVVSATRPTQCRHRPHIRSSVGNTPHTVSPSASHRDARAKCPRAVSPQASHIDGGTPHKGCWQLASHSVASGLTQHPLLAALTCTLGGLRPNSCQAATHRLRDWALFAAPPTGRTRAGRLGLWALPGSLRDACAAASVSRDKSRGQDCPPSRIPPLRRLSNQTINTLYSNPNKYMLS